MILRRAEEWPALFRFLEQYKEQPIPKCGLEVIVRAPRRSNPQNRYLWGVVYKTLSDGLSEQYGAFISPDYVHRLCKKYFMPKIEVPGVGQTVEMSTTELTRGGNEDSFQDYILKIQEFAAKKGLYIPDPMETDYEM